MVKILSLLLELVIKWLDRQANKKPSLRSLVLEKRERIRKEQARLQENLKKGNYEKLSKDLNNVLDDINLTRRMLEKDISGKTEPKDK